MKPTFTGELQLAGWSETHNGGAKVTFWLSSPDDLEPFRVLTVRKGNQAGHRFMAALVEIGDDELPVPQTAEPEKYRTNTGEKAENKKPGPLCWEAITLCQNAEFQKWALCVSESDTAEWMKQLCGVESRSEFASNDVAGGRFISLIRIPFMRRNREGATATAPTLDAYPPPQAV